MVVGLAPGAIVGSPAVSGVYTAAKNGGGVARSICGHACIHFARLGKPAVALRAFRYNAAMSENAPTYRFSLAELLVVVTMTAAGVGFPPLPPAVAVLVVVRLGVGFG